MCLLMPSESEKTTKEETKADPSALVSSLSRNFLFDIK